MRRFSIRNSYFIVGICLALVVIGKTSLVRIPVDLFPAINLPEVVVATFYSGRAATGGAAPGRRLTNSSISRHNSCAGPRSPCSSPRAATLSVSASIVALTQAQLNRTAAEIENTSAKYDYQTQYSVLQYAIGSLH